MGRQNIFTTRSVASLMPPAMMQDLVKFLIDTRSHIVSSAKSDELFKTRILNHTLISDIVHRLKILDKNKEYSLLQLPSKTVSLRESLDMQFIPIDLRQMTEVIPTFSKSLSLIPELNDKLVINVTDITRVTGELSNTQLFHHRVVRDFLSRSFYNSSGNFWLSPTLVRYVAKVYSMTIGGQLSKLFRLDNSAQSFIQTVFCAFYVGKMTSSDVAPTFMKAHARAMGLPDQNDLMQILSFIEDIEGKPVPDTLESVCKIIHAFGSDTLKGNDGPRVTRQVLNARFASLSGDANTSIIALEYPPYFAMMILMVLSGGRIALNFPMKNMNLIKEGEEVFGQLIKTPGFIDSI